MRVAVRKVPGVQSVEVSLERAVTEIRLAAGNSVTVAQLRKILKDGGFNSGAADVEAVGTLTQRDGAPMLVVSGTAESFLVVADAKNSEPFRWVSEAAKKPAGRVVLSGRIEPDGRFVVSKASAAPQ